MGMGSVPSPVNIAFTVGEAAAATVPARIKVANTMRRKLFTLFS
jgi:hypothetical protein